MELYKRAKTVTNFSIVYHNNDVEIKEKGVFSVSEGILLYYVREYVLSCIGPFVPAANFMALLKLQDVCQ